MTFRQLPPSPPIPTPPREVRPLDFVGGACRPTEVVTSPADSENLIVLDDEPEERSERRDCVEELATAAFVVVIPPALETPLPPGAAAMAASVGNGVGSMDSGFPPPSPTWIPPCGSPPPPPPRK